MKDIDTDLTPVSSTEFVALVVRNIPLPRKHSKPWGLGKIQPGDMGIAAMFKNSVALFPPTVFLHFGGKMEIKEGRKYLQRKD